eukprot:350683-Chlamydomonas_euryale.AAC.5
MSPRSHVTYLPDFDVLVDRHWESVLVILGRHHECDAVLAVAVGARRRGDDGRRHRHALAPAAFWLRVWSDGCAGTGEGQWVWSNGCGATGDRITDGRQAGPQYSKTVWPSEPVPPCPPPFGGVPHHRP